MMMPLILLLLLSFLSSSISSSSSTTSISSISSSSSILSSSSISLLKKKKKVIVLDIDGTLYDSSTKVEDGIIHAAHKFCKEKLKLTNDEIEDRHKLYGSAVANDDDNTIINYYEEVYPDLPMYTLRKYSNSNDNSNVNRTGYETTHRYIIYISSFIN